jgi:translation initiation factor 2B subunit (eIF-2B alpha/beta/delta family)
MEFESRDKIAGLALRIFTDNMTVLVHGSSKAVIEAIIVASK